MEIDELKGVGKDKAAKLRKAGIQSVEQLSRTSLDRIRVALDLKTISDGVKKIWEAAIEAGGPSFINAADVAVKRDKDVARLTTGSKALDILLGRGLESHSINEIAGEFASGKTQMIHQLLINVQRPKEEGGLEAEGLLFDTEETFRPERLREIGDAANVGRKKPINFMHGVSIAPCYNTDHQFLLLKQTPSLIENRNVKLICVDGMMSHLRPEYVGRGTLAERQQKLNQYLHDLMAISSNFKIVVVLTNQVTATPTPFGPSMSKPIGGHIMGHNVTTRIQLRKGRKGVRIARVAMSPWRPYGECTLIVDEEGVHDTSDYEEEQRKKEEESV